jgi:transposase-like protein
MTTMKKIRKRHTPAFKAQLVRELFKEEQTQSQIASKHGVHPNQLREWKKYRSTGTPWFV